MKTLSQPVFEFFFFKCITNYIKAHLISNVICEQRRKPEKIFFEVATSFSLFSAGNLLNSLDSSKFIVIIQREGVLERSLYQYFKKNSISGRKFPANLPKVVTPLLLTSTNALFKLNFITRERKQKKNLPNQKY